MNRINDLLLVSLLAMSLSTSALPCEFCRVKKANNMANSIQAQPGGATRVATLGGSSIRGGFAAAQAGGGKFDQKYFDKVKLGEGEKTDEEKTTDGWSSDTSGKSSGGGWSSGIQ